MSTTVRRNEAATDRHFLTGPTFLATVVRGVGAGLAAVMLADDRAAVLLMVASWALGKRHGPDKAFERGLLLAYQFRRPNHLEEPGLALARQNYCKHAHLLTTCAGACQINIMPRQV